MNIGIECIVNWELCHWITYKILWVFGLSLCYQELHRIFVLFMSIHKNKVFRIRNKYFPKGTDMDLKWEIIYEHEMIFFIMIKGILNEFNKKWYWWDKFERLVQNVLIKNEFWKSSWVHLSWALVHLILGQGPVKIFGLVYEMGEPVPNLVGSKLGQTVCITKIVHKLLILQV